MLYILLVFVSVVFLALQFSVNKAYQRRFGAGIAASLTFTALSGLLTALLFFCANGLSLHVTPISLLYGCGIAALCLTYSLIGFRIFSMGPLSVYTLFLMLGGMILPYFYGVLALNEPVTAARIVGLILLILSLLFPLLDARENRGNGRTRILPFFALCVLVFVLNGGVSILSKAHQITPLPTAGTTDFVILTNGINGILSALSLGIVTLCKRRAKPIPAAPPTKRWLVLVLALAGAACNGISYFLQLVGAAHIDASMLYPLVTGGSVVLSALAGALFFHEIPRKWSRVGLVVTFCATLLFLF